MTLIKDELILWEQYFLKIDNSWLQQSGIIDLFGWIINGLLFDLLLINF